MTRDRLAELRQKARIDADGGGDADGDFSQRNNNDGNPFTTNDGTCVIEMQPVYFGMERFFEQVEDIRKLIEELKHDVRNVKSHHSDILSKPVPDERKKQELDGLMATIKTSSQVVRSKLKDVEKGIHEEQDQIENDETPASLRIRKTQHSALVREFVDAMNEYQKAQVDYRDRCKGRIKRQLNITETSFTDDEVENMIEEGNFSVFTQGILAASEQAKQMLADVEARHNDILKLEKSLRELHDLFLEMAMLVESQGEVVDRIENQVTATKDYTEKAREQLKQAEVLQTKARKKKIIIIIVVIIILIVLGLIIYFSIP